MQCSRILSYGGDDVSRSISLDESKIEEITSKIGEIPIAIISVVRRHKHAFIFNILDLYFRNLKTNDWSREQNMKLTNTDESSEPGIWMKDEPILIEANGSPLAILLLDVQGAKESLNNEKEWSQMVGLSVYISSHTILDCHKFIPEPLLAAIHTNIPSVAECNEVLFQHLHFLVHGWLMTYKYPYGCEGGKDFLKSKLEIQERQSDQAKLIRKQIPQNFESSHCFLLPPADHLTSEQINSKFAKQFSEGIDIFLKTNFDHEKIIPKKLFKQNIKNVDFKAYLKKYVDILNGKTSETLFEGTKNVHKRKRWMGFGSFTERVETYESENTETRHFSETLFEPEEENQPMGFEFSDSEESLSNAGSLSDVFKLLDSQKPVIEQEENVNNSENFNSNESSKQKSPGKNTTDSNINEIQEPIAKSRIKVLDSLGENVAENVVNAGPVPRNRGARVTIKEPESVVMEFDDTTGSSSEEDGPYAIITEVEDDEPEPPLVSKWRANFPGVHIMEIEDESMLVTSNLIPEDKEDSSTESEQNNTSKEDLRLSELINKEKFDDLDSPPPIIPRRLSRKFEQKTPSDSTSPVTEKTFAYANEHRKLLSELISSVYDACCGHLSETPRTEHEVTELAERTKKMACEEFSKAKGAADEVLANEYELKLMSLLEERFDQMSAVVLKTTLETKAKQFTAEVIQEYKEKMDTERFHREKDIEVKHKHFSIAARYKFTGNETTPLPIVYKLLQEIDTQTTQYKEKILEQFKCEQKRNDENYEQALKESLHLFRETTAMFLATREFHEDATLELQLTEKRQAAEEVYENYPMLDPSDPKYMKNYTRLSRELNIVGTKCMKVNEANRKKLIESIERLRTLALGNYNSAMKKSFKTTSNQGDLLVLHEQEKQRAAELFHEECAPISPEMWQSQFRTLEEDIEISFEDILQFCNVKWNQQSKFAELEVIEAKKHYHGQMKAQIPKDRFVETSELQNIHQNATEYALRQCKGTNTLTEGQIQKIKVELEISYLKYHESNLMNLPKDPAIGIDLGTTYSCVAVYHKGKVEVITNLDSNSKTTPSYVTFHKTTTSIGEIAKEQATLNPESTVFDAKRLIGRRFDDKHVQNDMRLWPFKVVNENDCPKIEVEGLTYFPEQISARVLAEMKRIAEQYLGCPVQKAVVTVPAYFNDGQRQATIDAGELAGLDVLRILNEPTAAAIAYNVQHLDQVCRNVLIYDLGGGTFDVAVLEMKKGTINVKAVDGDNHLGGQDIDTMLSQYCVDEFIKKNGVDVFSEKHATNAHERKSVLTGLTRLKHACERAKKILSINPDGHDIFIDSVASGIDLKVHISRTVFEELNNELFRKTIEIVDRALISAKVSKSAIDDIVLVGGSTRIPKVQQLLSQYFDGKALLFRINPDEAVAIGAAIHAAILNGVITKESDDYNETSDVTPMSIGVRLGTGKMAVIIPKNTKFPHKVAKNFYTSEKKQDAVEIDVYQGENEMAAANTRLGNFVLRGIPKANVGKEKVKVEMEIDCQGVLHVCAQGSKGNIEKGLKITSQKWRLSRETINKIVKENAES